ncbi:hypothetical protein BC941DRAFT_415850 [Chlamydoabsidia padenii]|nr:hypothetical protein BC941DRAFT_415850 [Chlamydoabsidia padenii]
MTPDSLMMDPTGDRPMMISKLERPWRVKVLGLPSSGAKSRVETQIKICLQLTNTTGDLATNWTHLMLPEHMVARDKLKRRNQKSSGVETQANDDKPSMVDSEVLRLEAAVVCDGQPDNEIIMCSSCVHRERKRMKRKRDNKVARAANKEGGAAKLAALFASDLPDLSNENVMAEERKKILLFNCNEYVEFNNGEATLPTRVTCYCRHHSEKVGFRIVFTIKDCHNHVLGTGRSPPIMITDDHKSSKAQSATPGPQTAPTTTTTTTASNRKRSRNDEGSSDVKQPALSKRKGPNNNDAESDSVISSPVTSTPATPISNVEEGPSTPTMQQHNNNSSRSPSVFDNQHITPSVAQQFGTHLLDGDATSQGKLSNGYTSLLQTTTSQNIGASSLSGYMNGAQQGELFDFLNSGNLNMDNIMPMGSTTTQQLHQPQQQLYRTSPSSLQHNQLPQQDMMSTLQQQQQLLSHLSQNSFSNIMNRRRPTTMANNSTPQSSTQANDTGFTSVMSNVYSKMFQQRKSTEKNKNKNNLPRLHRLIPSEGPIYGGSEVTVLGSNFYEGLTCLFGENPAMPTHCWSTNTLLCILPPATSAGPVVVSFKEHPLMLEGQDVVLFTYYDESDRALMELALQVVGLKTMGKVEDARQIAMRIVQGGGGNNNNQQGRNNYNGTGSMTARSLLTSSSTCNISYRHYLTTKAAQAAYDNACMLFYTRLEEQIISALVAVNSMNRMMPVPCSNPCDDESLQQLNWIKNHISLTNRNRHTLLHLAAIRGYDRLVRILVHLNCDVNQTDKNGFTALHFASWTGKVDVVRLLIDKTDWCIKTVSGKTALQLALDSGHHGVVALFDKMADERHSFDQGSSLVRRSSIVTLSSSTSLLSTSSSVVRVPLIDILPSSAAVSSARSILPDTLFNMLSFIYVTSTNTPCVQQLAQSVTTVYTSMLDPF